MHKIDYFYSKLWQMRWMIFLFLTGLTCGTLFSQSGSLNEKAFATFGNMVEDGRNPAIQSQTIFFAVPEAYKNEIYLRVFDPDCGGAYDQPNGLWETNTVFEVYGGEGCISELDARGTEPVGNYKSGTILYRALFACESEVDGKWVSFGPFAKAMGEKLKDYPGYLFFKLIVEGRTGNDGNVYALSVSSHNNTNKEIENAAIFEYRRTYLDGDSLVVHIPELKAGSEKGVPVPLQLKAVKEEMDISIIVEPIDK